MSNGLTLATNKDVKKNILLRKKGHGCNWTWETIQHYTLKQIKAQEEYFYCCSTFHIHSKAFNKFILVYITKRFLLFKKNLQMEQSFSDVDPVVGVFLLAGHGWHCA